ncbi:hypothetical protein TRIUR3_33046 [Triticum urartu]|uniref:Uncharacterized protein n=1 Tax=Triticum urartu TaxID=4572 RepID=M7ZAF3_TRIUA|nr:hypothetical protein TRIUR3_33046 [Triticum urartu]
MVVGLTPRQPAKAYGGEGGAYYEWSPAELPMLGVAAFIGVAFIGVAFISVAKLSLMEDAAGHHAGLRPRAGVPPRAHLPRRHPPRLQLQHRPYHPHRLP